MRRRLCLAALGGLLALPLSGATALGRTTATPAAHAASTSPGVLFNREIFQYKTSQTTAAQAARYSVVVLNAADAPHIATLRAENPHILIFMYQSALQSQTADPTGITTCTPYGTDNTSHPTWFLTDPLLRRIYDKGYPTNYLMDVGNPAYQQACISHADQQAQALGFNGVFFDDVTANALWAFPPGESSPKYPNMAAWQSAMSSWVSYAASHSSLPIIANLGGTTVTPGLWQKWASQFYGAMEESWTDGGAGLAQQVPDWPAKLANVAWSEAHGKVVLLHSYNKTETGNTYGLASMLLVAGGHTSYATAATYQGAETWYPEYSTAQLLGSPLGSYSRRSNGVYERQFQNGVVLVNPTLSSVRSFSIGGGAYSGSGLTNVSSVSLGPTSGLVLLRAPTTTHATHNPPPATHKTHKKHKKHKKHKSHKKHHKRHHKKKHHHKRKHHSTTTHSAARALGILALLGL